MNILVKLILTYNHRWRQCSAAVELQHFCLELPQMTHATDLLWIKKAGNAPITIRLSAPWNGKSVNLECGQAGSFAGSHVHPTPLIFITFDMGLNLTRRYAMRKCASLQICVISLLWSRMNSAVSFSLQQIAGAIIDTICKSGISFHIGPHCACLHEEHLHEVNH